MKLKAIFDKYKNLNIMLKASLWFVIVTIFDRSVSILTQPFLNRILTVEEVGAYGVYQSWYSIFNIIATFYLFCGILEVYLTNDKDNKNSIVSSLTSLSILLCTVVFIPVFVFRNSIGNFLSIKPSYLLIMGLTIVSEAIINFWVVPKRYEYSYKTFSFMTGGLFLAKSLLSVLFAYLFVNERLLGRLIGTLLPSIIVAPILLVDIFKKSGFHAITKYWKKALLFNLPLIPHYLSSVLLSSSDKVVIENLTSTVDVGYYTVAYSFASLALIVFTALNSAYSPFAMKAIKNQDYKQLREVTYFLEIFSLFFSILLIYFAPEGLLLLGGEKYLSSLNIVPILVVGIFLSSFYSVFSNIEFVQEKTKMIFPITLLGAAINIGLNFLLIPKFGYEAAAYTTFISYLVVAVAHFIVSYRIIKKDIYNFKILSLLIFIYVFLAMLSLILFRLNNIIRYIVINALIVGLVVIIVIKKELLKEFITRKIN